MGCLSKKGQYPSTGPPTYQIIKVTNANHMSLMKTSLTIFPCVLGSAFHIIRVCSGLSFAKKRIGPPCCTLFTFIGCYSLQIILLSNYSATYNFSTCRHYRTENYLSFPSTPRWVRHSYLSKRATIDPLYLWVIIHFVTSHRETKGSITELRNLKSLWMSSNATLQSH